MVPEHLTHYRRHLCDRYSPLTARDYALRVRQFLAWLEGKPLTADTLLLYREHLRREHSRAAVRGALAALSTWFIFLETHRLATGLPAVPPPLDPHESRQGRRN